MGRRASLDYNVGRFDCSSSGSVCTDLSIVKKPTFILFKRQGYYEFYYGKSLLELNEFDLHLN